MIWNRFRSILAGRRMWLKIKKKYDVDNGVYALLMPEEDRELNERALRHMDDLVKHRRARGIIILTDNGWVKQNAVAYSNNIIDVIGCPPEKADKLLSFCEFYRFSERLLVVSLTRPYGNRAWRSIGVQEMTIEDMVCLGIFYIRSWPGVVDEAWTITK
jgi:hypothetical protein